MIVADVMKKHVVTCAPNDDLAHVAALMKEQNCGFLPVVDAKGVVVGVATDRDVCLALAIKRTPSRVPARDIMTPRVFSCFSEDNAKTALAEMVKHHVRRLPVLDKAHGHLKGVLSLDDVAAAPRRRGAPTNDDVADALRLISAPRPVAGAGA